MVRKRLKETSYAAKTDNMRRVMERTNPDLRHLHEAGQWKLWIPVLGGLIWALSWAMQIAWDAVWVLTINPRFEIGPHVEEILRGVIGRLVFAEEISPDLTVVLQPLAKDALLLGVLSAWWNPRLKEVMRKKGGRPIGLWDFYIQQLIFLAVRGAVLYCITFHHSFDLEQPAHLFMLLFSFVVSTFAVTAHSVALIQSF